MQEVIDKIMIDSLFISGGTISEKQARLLAGKAQKARDKIIRYNGVTITVGIIIQSLLQSGGIIEAVSTDNMDKFNARKYQRMNQEEQDEYERKLSVPCIKYHIRKTDRLCIPLSQSEYILAKYL